MSIKSGILSRSPQGWGSSRKPSATAQDRALEWSRAGFLFVLAYCLLLLNLALIFVRSDKDGRFSEFVLDSELLPEELQAELPAEIQLSETSVIPENPIPDVQIPSPAAIANLQAVELAMPRFPSRNSEFPQKSTPISVIIVQTRSQSVIRVPEHSLLRFS